ncbi:Protein unc-45 A [Grifola frondosa]|uniref:Protein unc-45 A n=1 Tax=Grifola frondosa TaxID=5627 RepID=A0A1C7MUC3_GRIFR|nr:Protein unc-45 A [Grifola frondosa]
MTALDADLDNLLKKSQDKACTTLLPDELSLLINVFLPSNTLLIRSKAYIVLSACCQRLRSDAPTPDAGTESICSILRQPVTSRLADMVENELLAGLSFLSALFEVDWQSAAAIFQQDGVADGVADSVDLFPTVPSISRAVAHLLGRASGHKACRALVSSEQLLWLECKARQTEDSELRAAAAVALVKLSKGAGADAAEVGGAQKQGAGAGDEDLVKLMKGLVVDGHDTSSLGDAIEGLAYMSTDSSVKEVLSKDPSFLSKLFSFIPRRKGATSQSLEDMAVSPIYGAVVIISNLCAYRPRLTEEEAQMAKLRRMAKTSGGQSQNLDESNPLEDEEHVRARGRRLIKAGVVDALTAAVRATESRAVRLAAGKAFLCLVQDRENRGKVLQSGGAKSLMLIIQGCLPASDPALQSNKVPDLDASDIEPIQALAKLAITASPVQVFGPNEGALYDAIRPFSLMLVHPNSNLLQRFEALMALTNLSSQSAEGATRIARAEGLLNKVELLMLEEHTLVRRAATELVCNLVAGCEEMFDKYGGTKTSASASKLQVLVALCDIDDLPTRLAASGALATLTSSPDACETLLELQRERHRVLPILGRLIDPSIVSAPEGDDDNEVVEIGGEADPGLIHRGVICVRNLFLGVGDASAQELAMDADHVGLVRALVETVKNCAGNISSPLLKPSAEALKWLLERGIKISP